MVALAALCGFTALAVSLNSRGDAAFPGSNGRIAYAFGDAYNTSIWSANPDGTAPAQLTHGASESGPSYSADGNRIAMNRDNGVAVMNSDGSGLTQILNGSYSSSSNTEYVENYDTPEPESKTIPWVKINTWTEDWHSFWAPAFSPDGSQLAVTDAQGKSIFEEICAVEEKDDPACISYGYEYESEGAYYDFNSECIGCTSHLIAVNSFTGAMTGEVTPLSSTTEDYGPTFSPTGQIAFNRWSPSGGSQIFTVSGPGAPPVALTAGPNDFSPDFSPDGSRLVFDHGGNELGLVGAGGGPVSFLPVPRPPGAEWDYVDSPAFSPDGTRVTFYRNVPGSGTIEDGVFTMGADGSGPVKIINDGRDPNWQPIPLPPPVKVEAPLPPPIFGKTVNVRPARGVVKTKCKGEKRFTRLKPTGAQIPLGCLVDTRRGVVVLISARGRGGATQSAKFWNGLFRVGQTRGRAPYTTLSLAGSLGCGKAKRKRRRSHNRALAGASRKQRGSKRGKKKGKRRGRRLWGSGKGRFRTEGRYGSASVRGTIWLIADRCNRSTLFKVRRGAVKVRDFPKKKTVTLRKGRRYVARAGGGG